MLISIILICTIWMCSRRSIVMASPVGHCSAYIIWRETWSDDVWTKSILRVSCEMTFCAQRPSHRFFRVISSALLVQTGHHRQVDERDLSEWYEGPLWYAEDQSGVPAWINFETFEYPCAKEQVNSQRQSYIILGVHVQLSNIHVQRSNSTSQRPPDRGRIISCSEYMYVAMTICDLQSGNDDLWPRFAVRQCPSHFLLIWIAWFRPAAIDDLVIGRKITRCK